jgi:hypothetical protein
LRPARSPRAWPSTPSTTGSSSAATTN